MLGLIQTFLWCMVQNVCHAPKCFPRLFQPEHKETKTTCFLFPSSTKSAVVNTALPVLLDSASKMPGTSHIIECPICLEKSTWLSPAHFETTLIHARPTLVMCLDVLAGNVQEPSFFCVPNCTTSEDCQCTWGST